MSGGTARIGTFWHHTPSTGSPSLNSEPETTTAYAARLPAPEYSRVPAHTSTIARLMDPLEYSRYPRQLVAANPELTEQLDPSKNLASPPQPTQPFLPDRPRAP